jgi:hypothetical protein
MRKYNNKNKTLKYVIANRDNRVLQCKCTTYLLYLQIFPNKTHGLNQKDIYADLDKIRIFRNRIAHHEPLCFDTLGTVNVVYVKEIYALTIKYIDFLGYRPNELLYGVETPLSTIEKIDELAKTI